MGGWAVILAHPSRSGRLQLEIAKQISVNGGYTFSEGVDVSDQTVVGLIISEVHPKSAGSYNINASFFMSEQAQVGFLFGQQFSTLELKTTLGTKHDAADMKVNNYHGIFTYNFGYSDSQLRPFIFGARNGTQGSIQVSAP